MIRYSQSTEGYCKLIIFPSFEKQSDMYCILGKTSKNEKPTHVLSNDKQKKLCSKESSLTQSTCRILHFIQEAPINFTYFINEKYFIYKNLKANKYFITNLFETLIILHKTPRTG